MIDAFDSHTADLFALPVFRNGSACPDGMSCRVCQSLLVIPPTGRPPAYCSNACKMKAYRARASVTKHKPF